jgi:hypothetical protein
MKLLINLRAYAISFTLLVVLILSNTILGEYLQFS